MKSCPGGRGSGDAPETGRELHRIERLEPEEIRYEQACGRMPMGGLLLRAREQGLAVECVDLRNSGDTAGSRDQVVGYGAWVFG